MLATIVRSIARGEEGRLRVHNFYPEEWTGMSIEQTELPEHLPEIAALLTIIGYSINDTIVVFDRIRENLKIFGKNKLSFRECVDLSINQTLSRTLLTSVTTLMTVCSLLFLGGEAIRGFAFTFMIGLIAGTYSSVFIASPILIMLRQRALLRKEELAKA